MCTLSFTPNPATAGDPITLKGTAGKVVTLDWDPPGLPNTATIGPNGQVVIDPPTGATSCYATASGCSTASVVIV